MKVRNLIPLAIMLVGCSTPRAHTTALAPAEAQARAEKLANEKARLLYNCEPFQNSPPAQLVQGWWVWHDRRGQGNADIEGTVKFMTDGSNPDVSVTRLWSMPTMKARDP